MQQLQEKLKPFEIYSLSERSVTLEFGNSIDIELLKQINSFNICLKQHPFPGMIATVPAYTSLSVFFDPTEVYRSKILKGIDCYERVSNYLCALANNSGDETICKPPPITIPACYEGEYATDLTYVASVTGLSPEEVIQLHSSAEYTVFMIGFIPGFAYLGGMPEKLATPRKATPRKTVPAGSIGIAGMQSGIYPLDSPGGWQIIGQTPLTLFDANRTTPSLLQAGDTIKFDPISPSEFSKIKSGF